MIPQLGLFFISLQVPLNKCFGWDWVLLFLFCFINLLGESRRWWKQKLRAKPSLEHIFFSFVIQTNKSFLRAPGLTGFRRSPFSFQSRKETWKRSWPGGTSFLGRPAGARPGWASCPGCPRARAPMRLAPGEREPPPPLPHGAGPSGGAG